MIQNRPPHVTVFLSEKTASPADIGKVFSVLDAFFTRLEPTTPRRLTGPNLWEEPEGLKSANEWSDPAADFRTPAWRSASADWEEGMGTWLALVYDVQASLADVQTSSAPDTAEPLAGSVTVRMRGHGSDMQTVKAALLRCYQAVQEGPQPDGEEVELHLRLVSGPPGI